MENYIKYRRVILVFTFILGILSSGNTTSVFAFGDDTRTPTFGKVLAEPDSLRILAEILDNVGVKDVNVIVSKTAYPMKHYDGNENWWVGNIPSDNLHPYDTVPFKIVARDYNNNIAEYSGSVTVSTTALPVIANDGASFIITPSTVLGHQPDPRYAIVTTGVKSDTTSTGAQITIKNTGTEILHNIRLMLSPELKGKFLVSDYAIKSIAPQSEATISLKLNGRPNVDAMNKPIPYTGQVIISIDNRTPYVFELSEETPRESASLQSLFMKMIANKAEERYKNFVKPDLRISQNADYKVTLGSGETAIRSASDELIITNTSDKPLKNLRIVTSVLADHFLPDQKNIQLVPPGSFVKVKLMSKLNGGESTKDLSGEVIIAPENGKPVTIPINIGKKLIEDKNAMYEVRTISGDEVISNMADGIIIRNNGEEAIDNVRLILPQELARVFSLSEDLFKSIEPNSEKTVYLQARGTADSKVKQIFEDYVGEVIIASSKGMKTIPLNMLWKGISSEHFVLYTRDNTEELAKAVQVINFLEHSYPEVAEIIGETATKTVIYMTSSLDELQMLSNALAPSTFVYNEDVGFVWSNSEDVNMQALKEFAVRTIMHNYGTYWTQQKIAEDKGNWLVDGISNYVAARVAGERGIVKNQLDSFTAKPESFEWHGPATPYQYGATYTLFKFLTEKYGDKIIDKILNNLDSNVVNNKCDTIEQCALVRGVYDANQLNINDRRHTLSFVTIVEDWKEYLQENYGMMFY